MAFYLPAIAYKLRCGKPNTRIYSRPDCGDTNFVIIDQQSSYWNCTFDEMMTNAEEKPRSPSQSAAFHDHCNTEQKECLDSCTILHGFASNDLHKFSILHQVFGACNVIKLIEDLPSDQTVDAINSMFYEASARLQDPALGCAGIIQQLQLQISDMESQITSTQAMIQKIRSHQGQLLASILGFHNQFNPNNQHIAKRR